MNKQEFLDRLRQALSGLPQEDIEERLAFYGEMIDDRVEDGLTEQEATAAIGSADEIAAQIVADTPLTKIVRERVRPKRRLRTWEIVLLVLGSPIWLSLLIAAFAMGLSVYVVIWAVVVSLWAVDAALIVSALGGVTVGVLQLSRGEAGLALVGAGITLAGLSIFLFFGCKAATKGAAILTKKIAKWFKALLRKKEDAA